MLRVSYKFSSIVVGILAILSLGDARKQVTRSVQQKNSGSHQDQIDHAATEAAGGIVLWGSPTLFQLKQASHLKRMSQNDRVPPQELSSEAMEKEVLSFGIGGVFIMMASPAVGRMADFIKTCVSNTVSKGRLLALHEGLQQAERAGGPLQVMKQFKGFLDGALQDGELTSAHAKYMGDIKALAQTQEVKQAILSAEHLNRTFLKYAISSVPPLIEGDAQGRAGATAGAGGDARKG